MNNIFESMNCEQIMSYLDLNNFENYKSNLCHSLKSMGDLPFIITILKKDIIRYCYKNDILLECFYLLGMIDYLCRINALLYDTEYNDIRQYKLSKPLFPEGVDFSCYINGDDIARKKIMEKAIPEFLWYNIIESDIRNVA